MGKLVNRRDMELMKMAMLKHEETFRQQVHELHRLYRIQKQLMSGLTRPLSPPSCRRPRRKQPRRAVDLRLPADEYIVVGVGAHDAAPPSVEDGLELTLAVGEGRARRRKRTPLASSDCSGGSLTTASSSSTDTSGSPPYQRATMIRLQEGTTVTPWLVQCLGLKIA
ncbi:hypothetical protein ACP4OV_007705 [Aristida adscensionis]